MLLLAACTALAPAQQPPEPHLLRRSATVQEAPERREVFRPGRSGLPDEATGSYALSQQPGEAIEIILNGEGDSCRLQGYLTRLGDGPSDGGAMLTYFFERTSVSPSQLEFTTRQVHGTRWSFAGTIDRGTVAQPTQKGYYFLNGTLTEHFDSGESQQQRVSLPLLPEGSRQFP